MCAKNYENWLAVDKGMTKLAGLLFGPLCSFVTFVDLGHLHYVCYTGTTTPASNLL